MLFYNESYDREKLKDYGFVYTTLENWHIYNEDLDVQISLGDNGEIIFLTGSYVIEEPQLEWFISIIFDLIKNNLVFKNRRSEKR